MPEDEFGAWLKRERKRRDLSVEAVAPMYGVSAPMVYLWERGVSRPQPTRFAAIESLYLLPTGTVASLLGQPLSGSALGYWAARLKEVTDDIDEAFERQRALLALMTQHAENPNLAIGADDETGDDAAADDRQPLERLDEIDRASLSEPTRTAPADAPPAKRKKAR